MGRRRPPPKLPEGKLARLTFLGAAREVTGSRFLLETAASRVLFECGMVQGGRDARTRNAAPFGFRPAELDAVVLTHAHIDHSGLLPRLVAEGYDGKVTVTPGTADLCAIMLRDAAHIAEGDAERASRHSLRRGGRPVRPLYTVDDAEKAIARLRAHALGEEVALTEDVAVRFVHAAHILGAASVEVLLRDGNGRRTLVFSGDLGRDDELLLRPPDHPGAAELVVMESTYGDRDHRSMPASLDELAGVIADAQRTGGKVLVPVFAVGRAQEVIHALAQFERQGRIASRPVYLDSPMAIDVTELYRTRPDALSPAVRAGLAAGEPLIRSAQLRFTRTPQESMAINEQHGVVVLAASGMCEGGRILHHLKHNLWRSETHLVFVGFQAEGTLGRALVDGARRVRVLGEELAVRATVHTVGGFSAHADQTDLLAWVERFGRPVPAVALVHGEEDRQEALAAELHQRFGATVFRPGRGDALLLPRSGRGYVLEEAGRGRREAASPGPRMRDPHR